MNDPAHRTFLLLLALLIGAPLVAQDLEEEEEEESAPYVLPSRRILRTVPHDTWREGSEEPSTRVRGISLEKVLLSALDHHPDLRVERHGPRIREFDVLEARSAFDPIAVWELSRSRSIAQSGSQLDGNDTRQTVTDSMTVGLRKLGLAGTRYDLSFQGSRNSNNSIFANDSVLYQTDLVLSVTQPLLRNLGIDVNRADLDIAKNALDQSLYRFQDVARDVLHQTERAYWDLVFARENLRIQEDSLRLTQESERIARIKNEVGTASEIDVLDARSNVADARLVLIQARDQVGIAEDGLKNLYVINPSDEIWNDTLVPTESLPIEVDRVGGTAIDLFESINHALTYRPDILQLRRSIRRWDIDVRRSRNLLFPQVDFVGQFSLTGLESDSFAESYDTLSTGKFFRWSAGLSVEFPFGNRAARARLDRALIEYSQAEEEVRRLERLVVLEVRNAVRTVRSGIEKINAAKKAKVFAREKWEAEQRRYGTGSRTAFEVNQFRNDYIRARSNEVQSFTEFYKALADLKKAEASALESFRHRSEALSTEPPH